MKSSSSSLMSNGSQESSSQSTCELVKVSSEVVKVSHEFIIKGYSHLKSRMAPQDSISSDKFQVGGYDWRMIFHPAYKNPKNRLTYVSVFLWLESHIDGVEASVEFSLRDQSETGKHKVVNFTSSFDSTSMKWGSPTFIDRITLENSDFLKADCLVIRCTLELVRKPQRGQMPPQDMNQSLRELMESGIGTDIVFEVGEETFKAHKLILAVRSPVFRAQFFGQIGNKDMDKVLIKEVEPSVFKAMLIFMYSDELPLSTPSKVVHNLLSAADRFDLNRLKLLCESRVCKEITTNTVTTILLLAENHHCSNLKNFCLQFVAEPGNLGEVMKSEGYEYLKTSSPLLALELMEFVCRLKC